MTSFAPVTTLSARLWAGAEDIYARILDHPFLTGLTSGDLDLATFGGYLVQDSHYLRQYSRSLSMLAARAPEQSTTAMFCQHAAGAIAVEQALHEGLLAQLDMTAEARQAPASPTTTAYTSYLLATTQLGSFAEGVAAVLPCYWIYWEVGKALLERSSPHPVYARWIATYGGADFGAIVRPVLELTDRLGAEVGPVETERMAAAYRTAARYEWMFWDAAFRHERWPV